MRNNPNIGHVWTKNIVLKLCGVSKVFLKESVQHYCKSCYFISTHEENKDKRDSLARKLTS